MFRFLSRRFTDHKSFRSLNREMRFLEVKNLFESLTFTDKAQEKLCKEQYLYALKFLKYSKKPIERQESLEKLLQEEISVYVNTEKELNILTFIGWGFSIGIIIYLIKIIGKFAKKLSTNHPVLSIVNSKSHIHFVHSTNVKFSDVKGIDDCREELEDLVNFLKNPSKYTDVGAKIPKGVLLTGHPGTGKTLLAKAIAGEAAVRFYYCSGSDFDEMFVGLGAKRIRDLFQEAKNAGPCIVFIDEIDSIANKRGNFDEESSRQTLNQLLVEMDGFTQSDSVIVIAATNFPESLDAAIKRPGRFDKIIDLPVPDLKARADLLEFYLNKVKRNDNIDIKLIAKKTIGFTGADIENMINIAALNAVKYDREACESEDFEHALDRLRLGIAIKSFTMSEQELLNTAYHEIGHALVAYFTKGAGEIHKITILPRGPSLGHTSIIDSKDKQENCRRDILANIDTCMGGRAAEEVFFGKDELTSGCTSDLKNATLIAYRGLNSGIFHDLIGFTSEENLQTMGEVKRNMFDSVVNTLLEESYNRAKHLLIEKKQIVEKLAHELKEHETLDSDHFIRIIKQYS